MAAIPFLSLSFSPLLYASYVLFLACHVNILYSVLSIYHNKIFQLKYFIHISSRIVVDHLLSYILESFTVDHKPLMGESPEIRGFFLGCGFNSSGMMLSKYFRLFLLYCNNIHGGG